MNEAGFVISKVIKDCRKQTNTLELKRNLLNQYQHNLDSKTSKSDELRRDIDAAKRKLSKVLPEKLKMSQTKIMKRRSIH